MKSLLFFLLSVHLLISGCNSNQSQKNKEFIIRYYQSISGQTKTPELLSQFIKDTTLLKGITSFDSSFPKYSMTADEMISEGNKVVVKATMRGQHDGVYNAIQPTRKNVETKMVLRYEIENDKIVGFWAMSNPATILEQIQSAKPVEGNK
ncbi:MAG: ester cyclase [Dyadobacter sp.]